MTPQVQDERKARQQFVRDRQTVVFTVAIAILAVALVISLLVFFGILGKKPQSANVESSPNYGVSVPCPVAGEAGNALAVANSSINVRVLNGTGKSGLADAVTSALAFRGFVTQPASNYPGTQVIKRTQVLFGKNAINEAYTLAAQFNDAILQMDDREDKLIDVVIGSTFSDLNNEKDIHLSTDKALTKIQGCVSADAMKSLPKAVQHDPIN